MPEPSSHRQAVWSIRTLLGLSILVPLGLFAWMSWSSHEEALAEAEKTAVRTVTALHEHMAKVLETHEVVLREIDGRVAGLAWDEITGDARLQAALGRIAGDFDQVNSISLIDADGIVRLSSVTEGTEDHLVADRDYFIVQQGGDAGTYISAPFTNRLTGERVIALSTRRTAEDGRFDGVIALTVPIDYLTAFWEQFAPTIDHIIPLVRSDGRVIARYPALNNPEWLQTDGPFLSRALVEPQGVYKAHSLVDGIERLNAYTRIKDYPLFVSFSIETRAILARWYETVTLYGVFTILAVIALIGATFAVKRQYQVQQDAARRWQEAADRLAAEMAAREKAEEALRHSQKMEAIGQITGGVAHDFNNLLQVITGQLYLLSKQVPNDARAMIDSGMQAVERGAKLVQQLMAFSRRQELRPQPVDLRDLIAGMGGLLQRAVGDSVRVEVELDRDLEPVMVDPTQTELAILNLAINARDAMEQKGCLTIAARNVEVLQSEGPDIKPGQYVVLSITDTGRGMSPEIQAKAFDPFFTTKDVGKGTGLGLSMVHGFVNQSGGGITLDSRVNHGTTVRLYLPKSDARPETEKASTGAAPTVPEGKAVLLVDDEALGRMASALALRGLGYRVHEARDGEEALAVLEKEPSLDMMVTDYAMPGMTGAELAEVVRRRFPKVKVIMITGYTGSMLEEEKAALSALIRKPFRIEELAGLMSNVLSPTENATSVPHLN